MKLIDSLNEKLQIETLLEENNGEITNDILNDIVAVCSDISQHMDRFVYALQIKNQEVEYLKEVSKGRIRSLQNQIQSLKEIGLHVVNRFGDQQSPMSYIKKRSRKSTRVIIEDFETVMISHSECVMIEVIDNKKIVTLQKDVLKKIYENNSALCFGFSVEENETIYADIRLRKSRS